MVFVPDALNTRALFAETLCQLMDSAGVSGAELARRLGSNKTSVSRWRTGEDLPRPHFVTEIADALGVDRTMLLQAAGYLKPSPGEDAPASLVAADKDETEWLALFRQFPSDQRMTVTQIVRLLAVQPTRQAPKRPRGRLDKEHERDQLRGRGLPSVNSPSGEDDDQHPDNRELASPLRSLRALWKFLSPMPQPRPLPVLN